ncbi:hypothetical protein RND71_003489 [Anisodus tanguticus]|uniref:3-hydroxyisobutyryl-CoA hydrolase n=1 Tax=Anisodus tanguticus TaxID=243964 RepID=A0AAE1SWV9_9SOLA|nr:hypothetical protein RND71_003489 [Anisodus tanguticus]
MQLYTSWKDDPDVWFIVLKGKGRAFCAGGDVINTYNMIKKGNIDECKELYQKIYSLAYVIGTYLKPQIFANPETLIGFHPDAGASFYLSHLPGYLGFVAMGNISCYEELIMHCMCSRVPLPNRRQAQWSGNDVLWSCYTLLSSKLPLIVEQLRKLMTDDPSLIGTSLAKFGDVVHLDQMSVLQRRSWVQAVETTSCRNARIETLNKCFSNETVEEIIDSLNFGNAWCISTLKRLREVSPLSLKVSLRSGVRAWMLDKDLSPKWDPPSLEHVTNDMVDEYFSSLTSFEPDLELPIQQRDAFA